MDKRIPRKCLALAWTIIPVPIISEEMTRPINDSPHRPPTFDTPEQEVFLNLWRTYDCLRALEDELFSQYELTAQQYNALRLLKAARPGSLPTLVLASRLVSRAPDITRLLDRLEDRGLVRRHRPAENRRQVLVTITDAGMVLLRQLAGPVRECAARQLGHLSTEQKQQLTALLRAARQPHEKDQSDW
jgi:DNA-binding MarR family transcriptional regulator